MTKPLFDQEIHEERRSRPAPLGEWMRVCRMQTSIKKANLKSERLMGMVSRAKEGSARREKLLEALGVHARERAQLWAKVDGILKNAFKDWEANDFQIALDSDTCHVHLFWDWPAQTRTIIFSFNDPLTVKEE